MSPTIRRCLLLTIALFALRGSAVARSAAEPLPYAPAMDSALARGVREIQAAATSPSLSFAVVDRGRIVFARAIGTADVATARAATPRTRYAIGSVTKLFTAVAVMRLVERKRVGLSDTMARYLPWAPHASRITVRQLLSHRSGLPDYLDSALRDGATRKPTTPRRIIASLATRPLDFSPGSEYAYSNTNYVLLGLIVEQVSKRSLASFLREEVFQPAGLVETTVGFPRAPAPVATGYERSPTDAERRTVSPGNLTWYFACGDIVSTASDLARFDIALMRGALLRPATFAAMASAAMPTADPAGLLYGLGVQCLPLPGGRRLVGHHGGLPGFESDDEMIPADCFAVVVLGNDFHFATGPALRLALSTFYPVMTSTLEAMQAKRVEAHRPKASPAIDQLVMTFLHQLRAGRVDPALLTAEMQKALTPAVIANLNERFTSTGELRAVALRGTQRSGVNVRYQYTVAFEKQKVPMTFVLDEQGRIAGFFLQ